MPRLTVLMPVWNAMPFLSAAVDSILAQSFGDFVLFALDDGSTDGSLGYLQSVRDKRLQVVSDGAHRGLGGVLNLGIALAETEFLARMDGDDVCAPDRFERQMRLLDQHPDLGAVGTQFTYLGHNGRTGFGRNLPLDHDGILRGLRIGDLTLIHASLMMRTADVRAIGGYRFEGVGEDWDMFLRLAERTRFANIPHQSYFYRVHDGNSSLRQRRFTHRRIRYACRCADARARGLPEPSEEEFVRELATEPIWRRLRETLDGISLGRYLAGRNLVLTGHSGLGYLNLACGAVAGPWRTFTRLGLARQSRTPPI
jgi:glycosyltransferase involved in cell wall biosynthesis